MTTVVKLMLRRCLLQGTYAFRISFVRPVFFSLLILWTRERAEKRGENINKVQELAAGRTKYCSLVTLDKPCLGKRALGGPSLVLGIKERF